MEHAPKPRRVDKCSQENLVRVALKVNKKRNDIINMINLEDIAAKLEESGNATATQIELNRKREAELARLKEELENHTLQHESALASLRQKHNSVIADLGDQIDVLNKAKAKLESSMFFVLANRVIVMSL